MGKKRKGSFRTTISVPQDLKERMDAVTEPVNWSALACRAFEEKLGEIAAKKARKTMDDVIQRLRASKQSGDDGSYNEGEEEGRRWALGKAEAKELERLHRFQQRYGRGWDGFFIEEQNSAWSVSDWLAFEILPAEKNEDRQAAEDFWDGVLGHHDAAEDKLADGDWLPRFPAGAL